MPEKAHQSSTELEVWKKARAFKNEVFGLVKACPTEEKYRLADQLIRASRSITANIAEGHGRYSKISYTFVSKPELSECLNHLIDAFDLKYINQELLVKYKQQKD